VYDLLPLPAEVAKQIFIPLTPEERAQIPPLWEPSECKPSQDLGAPVQPPHRVLKPDMAELMQSMRVHHSEEKRAPAIPSKQLLTAEI